MLPSIEKPPSIASERPPKNYPEKIAQACPGIPRRGGGSADSTVWQDILIHLFINYEVDKKHHPQVKKNASR